MNPQTMLRAAESAAIQARKNNSSAIQASDNPNGSEGGLYRNDAEPPRKNPFKGHKSKSFVVIALIMLLLLFGAGTLIASSPLNIIGMMMSNLTDVSDTQYPGNLARYHKIASGISAGQGNSLPIYDRVANSSSYESNLESNNIDPDNITEEQIENQDDYRARINKAGNIRAMGYYDDLANTYYTIRSEGGDLRNKFKNFRVSDNIEKDEEEYNKTMEKLFETTNNVDAITYKTLEKEEKTTTTTDPETGETKTTTTVEWIIEGPFRNTANGSTTSKDHIISEESKQKARSYLQTIAQKASREMVYGNEKFPAGRDNTVPSKTCLKFRMANMVATTLYGLEKLQSVKYSTTIAENMSKTMAGYGSESAIHNLLNTMFTPDTAEILDMKSANNMKTEISTKTVSGAPLEEKTLLSMLSDAPLDKHDGYDYSYERGVTAIYKAMGIPDFSGTECYAEYAAQNTIQMPIIGGVIKTLTSFFVSLACFTDSFGDYLFGDDFTVLVPLVAEIMFSNRWDITGSLAFGAHTARGFRSGGTNIGINGSGQSPGDAEANAAYNETVGKITMQDARIDRLNRSPLDASSKNTFLGSIIYSIMPIFLPGNSITSNITTIANTTSKSTTQIANHSGMNIANAAGKYYGYTSSYWDTFGDSCSVINGIDAEGDVFCGQTGTFDNNTISNTAINDSTYVNLISSQLDSSGNIIKGSELSKFKDFCADRISPYGILDVNVLDALFNTSDIKNASIEAEDAFVVNPNGINDPAYLWASGKYCMNTTSNPRWDNEFKYYQLFLADDRITAHLSGTKSVALAYAEQYGNTTPLSEEPLDKMISRISGLSINDSQSVIAFIQYCAYLNEYDASSTIAMDGEATQTIIPTDTMISRVENNKRQLIHNSDTSKELESQATVIATHPTIYADLRNRSFAIC